MTFGYEYGPAPDENDDEEGPDIEVYEIPPEHPASPQHCDHINCERETPEVGERICSECTEIMRADAPNTCERCGSSILD